MSKTALSEGMERYLIELHETEFADVSPITAQFKVTDARGLARRGLIVLGEPDVLTETGRDLARGIVADRREKRRARDMAELASIRAAEEREAADLEARLALPPRRAARS